MTARTDLSKLIKAAAGFRSRDARDRPVLVRFTEAELVLIDSLASDWETTRIETLRRLLDNGITKIVRYGRGRYARQDPRK